MRDNNARVTMAKISCSSNSPLVECNTLDNETVFLVDSGSHLSLANNNLYLLLKDKLIKGKYPRISKLPHLVSVTGQPLSLICGYKVPLTIGNKTITVSLWFCKDNLCVEGHGILGYDTLVNSGISMIKGTHLQIGNEIVPLNNAQILDRPTSGSGLSPIRVISSKSKLLRRKQLSRPLASKQLREAQNPRLDPLDHFLGTELSLGHEYRVPVQCVENVEIPAQSEYNLVVKPTRSLKVASDEVALCEGVGMGTDGVAIGNTLINPLKPIFAVRVINLNTFPVPIPRNKTIGYIARGYMPHPCCPVSSMDSSGMPQPETDPDTRVAEILKETEIDFNDFTKAEVSSFKELLKEYNSIFRLPGDKHGFCPYVEHKIETGDARPVNRPPYKIPDVLKPEMDRHIKELLAEGLIRPSVSSYGAGIVLVKKKDGSTRFCVDYRFLNRDTIPDTFPIPVIGDLLDSIGNAKYFSTCDLASGFFQLPMHKDSISKTAFNSQFQKFEFVRLPQGLRNSPSTFQRCMNTVFSDMLGNTCLIYLDDIIICSESIEEHLQKLRKVFQKLKESGLKLQPKKCHFICPEVEYLGYTLNQDGISPPIKKVDAIKNIPQPKSVRDIQVFLGLTGYFRRHICRYAEIARPLTDLIRKNEPFNWGESQQKAFDRLKDSLVSAPVLKPPDFQKKFYLSTDASNLAIAGVLQQKDEKGKLYPVCYTSRKLKGPETRYSTTEKELLAILFAVEYFRSMLYGRAFVLLSDHQPLKWIISRKNPTSRLSRWSLRLANYTFEIQHVSGSSNRAADALSRLVPETETIEIRDVGEATCSKKGMVGAVKPGLKEYVPVLDEARFLEEQSKDAVIQDLKSNELLSNPSDYYTANGGLLYKVVSSMEDYRKDGWNDKVLIVPHSLKLEIMKAFHETPFSAHLGFDKTYSKIKQRYFWKSQHKDIKEYCEACVICQERKRSTYKGKAPLQSPLADISRPWQRISMDVLCNLPRTHSGNIHLLVIVCNFTRYIEVFAMPDQTADTVARIVVDNIICRYGVPSEILTDRGSNFLSKLFLSICDLLHIKKLSTTPFSPQSDGLAERSIQSIQAMLSTLVEKNTRNWDEFLSHIRMAHNCANQKSLGETPHFLVFGQDVNFPIDTFLKDKVKPLYNFSDYKFELIHRLETAFYLARQALEKSFKTQKRYFDKNLKNQEMRVGDKVMLHQPISKKGVSRKLSRLWTGPFRIVQVISPVNFKIKRIGGFETKTVHMNRLKIFRSPQLYDRPTYESDKKASKDASSSELQEEEENHIFDDYDLEDWEAGSSPSDGEEPKSGDGSDNEGVPDGNPASDPSIRESSDSGESDSVGSGKIPMDSDQESDSHNSDLTNPISQDPTDPIDGAKGSLTPQTDSNSSIDETPDDLAADPSISFPSSYKVQKGSGENQYRLRSKEKSISLPGPLGRLKEKFSPKDTQKGKKRVATMSSSNSPSHHLSEYDLCEITKKVLQELSSKNIKVENDNENVCSST